MGTQKTVIVTGGASGIGAATARRFLQQDDSVVVIDRNGAQLAEVWSDEPDVLCIEADITDTAALALAKDAVEERYGTVGTLIANAGAVVEPLSLLDGLSHDQWTRTIDVNLTGTYNTVQAFLPLLRAHRGRRAIVLTSSIVAVRGSGYMTAYTSAKAGVMGLMTSLAQGLGGDGITVNAVAPSLVRSQGFETVLGEGPVEKLRGMIPVGRLGENADIAGATAFLASDDSSYISGQMLVVDGGLSTTAFWHPYWAA